MAKIIHTADIHLDSPFSLFDVQKAHERKNERREVFFSLIKYAENEKADMMLIAGDLFDSEFVTKNTVGLLCEKFASVPSCKFVIAPGNHDPASEKSPYLKSVFPDNVYIFDRPWIEKKEFPDINVDVYGFGCTGEIFEDNPVRDHIQTDPERINIFIGHVDMLGTKPESCPTMTEDEIARTGCDYAALGHIHKGTEVKKAGKTCYAYSGCLEGGSFDECGAKGAIVLNITKSARSIAQTDFSYVRFSRRRYEKIEIDATGANSCDDIKSRIRSAAAEKNFGRDVLLRVYLTGRVAPEVTLHPERVKSDDAGTYYLEIIDKTAPLLSYEELKSDISIRGALFRELLPKLESPDEKERALAEQALKYGLGALAGEDIIDF